MYLPFWGCSRSISQDMVSDAKPLVKSENDPPMNFSILTPLPPVPRYPMLGCVCEGGGGQGFFAYWGRRVLIWTRVVHNFFLVYGPPNPWRGSRVQTLGTPGHPPSPPSLWPLAHEDLPVFTLDWLFSGT